STRMSGAHQRENAAVAIDALKMLAHDFGYEKINNENIVKGIAQTAWMGRFEKISEHPLIVIDGAHNKEGMESLAQTLQAHYPNKRYRFVVAATIEKDIATLLSPFKKLNTTFTFTSFNFFRAAKALHSFQQATVSNKRYVENWEQAVLEERNQVEDDE